MKKIFSDNRGLSIVEMLIVIWIMSVLMTGISIFLVKIWKDHAYTYETGQDTMIASRSVNLVGEDLRRTRQADNGDYAIVSADEFEVTAYIDIDNDDVTEKVHYFLDRGADQLKMGVSEPSGDIPPVYPSGDDTVEVLASHVVNEDADPPFGYFGRDYLLDDTPFSTPVGAGEIINIRLVKIKLLVDVRPYHSPDHVTIESFVQLRNLKDHEQ